MWNIHTGFHSSNTILYNYQQCTGVPFSLYPCQFLFVTVLEKKKKNILTGVRWYLIVVLIWFWFGLMISFIVQVFLVWFSSNSVLLLLPLPLVSSKKKIKKEIIPKTDVKEPSVSIFFYQFYGFRFYAQVFNPSRVDFCVWYNSGSVSCF